MSEGAGRRLRVYGVRLGLEEDEGALPGAVAGRLGTSAQALGGVTVVKRSFDARKNRPGFVYIVDAQVAAGARLRTRGRVEAAPEGVRLSAARARRREPVVVVGAGPAGLFAALMLARAGLRPTIIDRGKAVEARGKDVGALMNRAQLDEDSNLCFGEGGAGTWSDGKLTTRIGGAEIRFVLETLHEMGGPARILVDGKPHLGTDRLVKILKRLRGVLEEAGATFRYSTRVRGLWVAGGRTRGVVLEDGERVEAPRVVLAIGHSARELYERLIEQGVAMEPKPFAVGFRVEHPQALINEIQYGRYAEHPRVPTADYALTANYEGADKRGVYSFCMCPGGQIMPTMTRADEVVVNGMSNASRSGRYANAALVVTVGPEDFARHGTGVLAGADLQRAAERAAARLGGGAFRAPAQRVTDFLAGRASTALRRTSYRPGVTPAALDEVLDAPVIAALRRALGDFERRMRGFVTDEAVLHAVETRTSAPVRILRGAGLQSVSVPGLYPCGEGAGFAGGIVSAAVDGIRVAEQIARELAEG